MSASLYLLRIGSGSLVLNLLWAQPFLSVLICLTLFFIRDLVVSRPQQYLITFYGLRILHKLIVAFVIFTPFLASEFRTLLFHLMFQWCLRIQWKVANVLLGYQCILTYMEANLEAKVYGYVKSESVLDQWISDHDTQVMLLDLLCCFSTVRLWFMLY